jgi:hypothetical protein
MSAVESGELITEQLLMKRKDYIALNKIFKSGKTFGHNDG